VNGDGSTANNQQETPNNQVNDNGNGERINIQASSSSRADT